MLTVDWVHVCNHAFLNDHKEPCIIGIVSLLVAPSLPYHRASVSIACQVTSEATGEFPLVFELGPVKGDYLRRVPMKARMPPGKASFFLSMKMVQVFFPTHGEYEVRVKHDDHVLGRSSFRILGAKQTPPRPLGVASSSDSQD